MASFFDTHISVAAQRNDAADLTAALGAAARVMSRWGTAHVGRTRGGLNAGATEALRVRCART